jgi:hypothetical protein
MGYREAPVQTALHRGGRQYNRTRAAAPDNHWTREWLIVTPADIGSNKASSRCPVTVVCGTLINLRSYING